MKKYCVIFVASVLLGCMGTERFGLLDDIDTEDSTPDIIVEVIPDITEEDSVLDVIVDPIEDPTLDPIEDDVATEDAEDTIEEDTSEEEVVDLCGNSTIDTGEQCDDGDINDCNSCSNVCLWERAISSSGGYVPAASITGGTIIRTPWDGTWEMWFKPNIAIDVWQTLAVAPLPESPRWAWKIMINTASNMVVYRWGQGSRETVGYATYPSGDITGEWHHLAITREIITGAVENIVYWDGIRVYSDEHALHISDLNSSDDIKVGDNFAGAIDDLNIADAVIYSANFIPTPRGVVPGPDSIATWHFNDIVGGQIIDISGNRHNLAVGSGTLTDDGCHI